MTLFQIVVLAISLFVIYELLYRQKSNRPNQPLNIPVKLSPWDIQLLENSPSYSALGQAMMNCVAGIYQSCGLVRPTSLPTHFAKLGNRIIQDSQGTIFYVYIFDRCINGMGGMQLEYSTIPTSEMVSKLNESIGNYTLQAGYPVYEISSSKDLNHGRVQFCLKAFNSWAELQNELASLRSMQGGYGNGL